MTDEYMISENGFFFTDINAPTIPDTSYGDLNPPAPPPFTPPEPGITTLDDGKVVEYEDDEIIMSSFVYDVNDKLVSYIETNKATSIMTQYTFTRTPAAPAEPVGTDNDYQNFAISGQVDLIGDDVPNSSIENYTVTTAIIPA
jgi:hypothetical protein